MPRVLQVQAGHNKQQLHLGNTETPGMLVWFEREAEDYCLFLLFSSLSPCPTPEAMATEPPIFHRLLHQRPRPPTLPSSWTCLASCRLQLTHLPYGFTRARDFSPIPFGPFLPQIHPLSKVHILFSDSYNDSLSVSKQ